MPMQLNIWNNQNHNSYPSGPADLSNRRSINQSYMEAMIGNSNDSNINEEQLLGLSQGDHFLEKKIKSLLPKEGDYILQGRFGQSIRFGSTVNQGIENLNEQDNWSEGGNIGDPITIISNGLPSDPNVYQLNPIIDDDIEKPWISTMEDINNDPSSIYLTSTQKIRNFKPSGVGHASINAFKPEEKTELEGYTVATNYITETSLNNDSLPLSNEEDIITTPPSELSLEEEYLQESELANVEEEFTPFYIVEGTTDNNSIKFDDNVFTIIDNNPSLQLPEALEGIEIDLSQNIGNYFKLAHLLSTPKSKNLNAALATTNYLHPDAYFSRGDNIGFYIDIDNNSGYKKIITKEYLEGGSYRILEDEPRIYPINNAEPYEYAKTDIELIKEAESYIYGNYSNYGINNYPGSDSYISYESIINNLTNLFVNCIDPIIENYNGNIKITSAYRNKSLNSILSKNPSNSEHIYGYAVDIKSAGNNEGLYNYIYNNLEFKNLMWAYPERENNSWIHISFIEGKNYKKTTLLSQNDSYHNLYGGSRRGYRNYYQDNIGIASTPANFKS